MSRSLQQISGQLVPVAHATDEHSEDGGSGGSYVLRNGRYKNVGSCVPRICGSVPKKEGCCGSDDEESDAEDSDAEDSDAENQALLRMAVELSLRDMDMRAHGAAPLSELATTTSVLHEGAGGTALAGEVACPSRLHRVPTFTIASSACNLAAWAGQGSVAYCPLDDITALKAFTVVKGGASSKLLAAVPREEITAMCCMSRHCIAVAAGTDGRVRVWNTATQNAEVLNMGRPGAITALASVFEGLGLAWGCADGTCFLSLVGSFMVICTVRAYPALRSAIVHLATSSNQGAVLCIAAECEHVRVHSTLTGQCTATLGLPLAKSSARATAGVFAPRHHRICVIGYNDCSVRVWDVICSACIGLIGVEQGVPACLSDTWPAPAPAPVTALVLTIGLHMEPAATNTHGSGSSSVINGGSRSGSGGGSGRSVSSIESTGFVPVDSMGYAGLLVGLANGTMLCWRWPSDDGGALFVNGTMVQVMRNDHGSAVSALCVNDKAVTVVHANAQIAQFELPES